MIIKKDNIKFEIVRHTKLDSPCGLKHQINIVIDEKTYYVTNAGILPHSGFYWFCPKVFSKNKAKKYIENLNEEMSI